MGKNKNKGKGDSAKQDGEKSPQKTDTKVECELNPWPEYIQKRIEKWDVYMKAHKEELAAKSPSPIKVTLPDGKVVDGESFRTTPFQIAQGVSQGLADQAVISKVNGILWDLDRPLEGDCNIEILKFDNDEAKSVYWHSTAHMLGEAMERYLGGHLCYGPPIENGFYYDMYMPDGRTINSEDNEHLESIMKCVAKDRQPFERLELTKEQLMDLFDCNQFKIRILKEKVDTPTTTVYRCGPLIDLCRGPHVRHTGKVKAFAVTKSSQAYWEGKADAESLQRVYGISFPDAKQLKEWQRLQEEAAARNHKKIGIDQELFFFNEVSPGSAFFFPHGAHIYNKLVDLIKKQYRKRGFKEVISPNLYSSKLWETSGHWQHYSDNMFVFDMEKEKYGLKPMNCPGHCIMFDSRNRSWKELPLRYADFGALHRNELSGALHGLTRVRRFQQDDAHIFCTPEQVAVEIKNGLEFLRDVYGIFGFTFQLFLSTRPEKFMGEIAQWDLAEAKLKEGLDAFGEPWTLNPGDGAFYGPKIDIVLMDALHRKHQCATLQLDFQLPQRFNLYYNDDKQERQRPVIIHRAVLGSVERMMAILTENFGGKWPFWVSPRQAMVIPVHSEFDGYAESVKEKLFDAGFEAETNIDAGETLNKKVRNAQLAQFNFILVVGEKEVNNESVNVRTRDNKVRGERKVVDLIERFKYLSENYVKNAEEEL